LWLGILIVNYSPFEKLTKADENGINVLYSEIVGFKIRFGTFLIYILIFTLLRLAYFAVKKRLFNRMAA
jgi:hypothetical protein